MTMLLFYALSLYIRGKHYKRRRANKKRNELSGDTFYVKKSLPNSSIRYKNIRTTEQNECKVFQM